MRAVLIINPVSGDDEPNSEKVATIQTWRRTAPFVAEVCYTTKEGGAGIIARETVADGIEVVLVGGGDGTVSEVARELVHKPATLGILPIGTFNNFARSIGVLAQGWRDGPPAQVSRTDWPLAVASAASRACGTGDTVSRRHLAKK